MGLVAVIAVGTLPEMVLVKFEARLAVRSCILCSHLVSPVVGQHHISPGRSR